MNKSWIVSLYVCKECEKKMDVYRRQEKEDQGFFLTIFRMDISFCEKCRIT